MVSLWARHMDYLPRRWCPAGFYHPSEILVHSSLDLLLPGWKSKIQFWLAMSDIIGMFLAIVFLLVLAALAFTAIYELFELFHPLIHG